MSKPAHPIKSHACTSEKAIEHYFCAQMKLMGPICIKQFNPYETGWPDRLVVLPNGLVSWVEFKSTGKKPTPIQLLRHRALEELGHHVTVISSREEAESYINDLRKHLKELNLI